MCVTVHIMQVKHDLFSSDHHVDITLKDNKGRTALSYACEKGNFEMAESLLFNGADINEALYWTSKAGHVDFIETLIAKGADVNGKTENGETPLMAAVSGGHQEVMKRLIDFGADVNEADSKGKKVLNFATKPKIIDYLSRAIHLTSSKDEARKPIEYHATPEHASTIKTYKVDKKHIGKALIVNIKHYYAKIKDRKGSEKDVNMMVTLFNSLTFEVIVKPSNFRATKDETMKILKDFAEASNHVNKSMCVVCIMGHGGNGYLHTTEGGEIDLEEIYGMFAADQCPTLAGKPKIFIIQTCRGSESQIGVYESDSSQDLHMPMTAACAHFAIIYATIPNKKAYRNCTEGSFLIQSINKVFKDNASKLKFTKMLMLVSEDVDKTEIELIKHGRITKDEKQTCCIEYRGFYKDIFFGNVHDKNHP